MEYISPVTLSILSGLCGCVLTSIFTIWNDNRKIEKSIDIKRNNLAKAIHTELSTLLEIYDKMKLKETMPQQGDDIAIAKISQNYISVYENNLDKIGILDNEDVKYIVQLYTYIKSLIDSLICLADRWEDYAKYTRELNANDKEKILKLHDVMTANKAAYYCQEKVFTLFPNVLDRLEKYNQKKSIINRIKEWF